jgi:hypothetical protein
MPTNWLTVRVELLGGGDDDRLWPRPGRIMLVGPRHTFGDLADAVNDAFGRWDLAHLWEFTLADGRRIALPDPDDDEPAEDARALPVARAVRHGAEFQYVFDLGEYWLHRCSVANTQIDRTRGAGPLPSRPVPVFGWGWLPDQYGRRWEHDDGETPVPEPPAEDDPMTTGNWP